MRMKKTKKGDLRKVFGILSKEEGEELRQIIQENRKRFNEEFERRAKKMFK